MATITWYGDGTATAVIGSKVVTGTGTGWLSEIGGLTPIKAGDKFGIHVGRPIVIEEIVSDTELRLADEWQGPDQTDAPYKVELTNPAIAAVEAMRRLLAQLANGTLAGISELDIDADELIMGAGPGSFTLINRSQLASGAHYDVQVDDLAGRAAYDASPEGFAVLVSDVGDGRSAVYSKRSAAAGDWTDAAILTGVGEAGPYTEITVGTVTTLPAGSPATVTPVVVDATTIRLDFGLPAGMNGDGAGSVISVNLTVPTGLTVTGGPVTNSGTFVVAYAAGYQGFTTAQAIAIASGGQNEAVLALEIADLKGSRLGMKGGVADAFDDETGVDVKTNAVYDAANDWYRPTSTTGSGQTAVHTGYTSGGNTVSASTNGSGQESWRAFDGITGSASGANTWGTVGTSSGWIQYQFSSAKTIGVYTVRSINGFADRAPRDWTLLGSNTGAFSGEQVVLDTRAAQTSWGSSGEVRTFTVTSPGSYLYYRLNVTANNGSNFLNIDEITMISQGVISDMTLRSVGYSATAQPTTGRIAVQLVDADALAINSDLIAKISRDGGTTWATTALSLSQSLVGPKIYEATGINLAALGAGTSMKWEISTANNKSVAVSGVVMQWS